MNEKTTAELAEKLLEIEDAAWDWNMGGNVIGIPDKEPLYICPSSVVIEKSSSAPEYGLSTLTNIPLPNVFDVPEEIERDTVGEEILSNLHITADDLADIPLYFPPRSSPMRKEELRAKLWERGRTALCVLAERKLRADYATIEDDSILDPINRGYRDNKPQKFTGDYIRMVEANADAILAMLADKDSPIQEIAQITVNGVNGATSINDGVVQKWSRSAHMFVGIESGKRPPVAIRIAPCDGHDIALLTGTPFEALDWRYRTWVAKTGGWNYRHRRSSDDFEKNFYDRHEATDPLFLLESPYDKRLLLVCIAMSKKAYKQYIVKKES